MSTIGAIPGTPPGPPEARTAFSLANKIETGEISSTDGAALASSLEAIHGELRADRQERRAQGPDGGGKPSREELTAKIDDLISSQVESGALTEEQGEQLSELFQETLTKGRGRKGEGGQGGPGGPGGPGGAGGPGGGAKSDALVQFLQQLQQENATEYGQDGTTTSSNQSLLFNYTA